MWNACKLIFGKYVLRTYQSCILRAFICSSLDLSLQAAQKIVSINGFEGLQLLRDLSQNYPLRAMYHFIKAIYSFNSFLILTKKSLFPQCFTLGLCRRPQWAANSNRKPLTIRKWIHILAKLMSWLNISKKSSWKLSEFLHWKFFWSCFRFSLKHSASTLASWLLQSILTGLKRQNWNITTFSPCWIDSIWRWRQ